MREDQLDRFRSVCVDGRQDASKRRTRGSFFKIKKRRPKKIEFSTMAAEFQRDRSGRTRGADRVSMIKLSDCGAFQSNPGCTGTARGIES